MSREVAETFELSRSDLARLKQYSEQFAKRGKPKEEIPRLAYQQWLRWKVTHDLYFFGAEFLGWKNATNKLGTRYRMDPVFHRWLCETICKPSDKLILVPRLHLKSTWIKLRIVQLILLDPNVRIGLFSATGRLVVQHMAWIRRVFANNKVRELFGTQIPDPGKKFSGWEKANENELTVWRDQTQEHVPSEPQLLCVGAGAEITGFHFDYAFLDDIVTDENVKSQSQLDAIDDWWEYLYPILEVDSEKTITGTPYFYRDLYNRVQENEEIPKDQVYIRRYKEGGKIVYSSWYRNADYEKLKRGMKPYKFSCQFEINPMPDEEKIFPAPQPTFERLPMDELEYRYYAMMDPAATQEAYSDHTGFVIIAVNHLSQVFVIESYSLKERGDKLADFLIRRHLRYAFKLVGIELGLQAHLATIIEMRVADYKRETGVDLKIPIQPIPVKKQNKATRIDTMIGSLVRTGRILILDRLTNLIGQMDNFTGRDGDEDDEIDALSMCPYVVETFAAHRNLPEEIRSDGMSIQEFVTQHGSQRQREGWNGRFKAS